MSVTPFMVQRPFTPFYVSKYYISDQFIMTIKKNYKLCCLFPRLKVDPDLQDPCAKNCFLWGRWNWNPFLRIKELHLLSVEGKIFVQQMQTRWTLSKKVGKINLIPDAMSSHGALETIVVPLKTLGALRSPHHSSPFPIIFIFRSKFCSPHHWRGSARNDITL